MAFNQIRDVQFTVVGQHAIRAMTNRTFAHLHELSLQFHLERRTGGLSRVLSRGAAAIELIMRMGLDGAGPHAARTRSWWRCCSRLISAGISC